MRHQLAVLQRRHPRRPNLNWADWALLAALFGVIPKVRRQGLRLLVTADTILRWYRDIVRRSWAARSMFGKTGVNAVGPAARPGTGDATAEWDAAGRHWTQRDWIPRPRRADLGHSEFTDAGRTECGFHAARNGEIAGQWPFRWVGMGVL